MKIDSQYNLRPVWDVLLDVYKQFVDVCEKSSLRHYVTGGTALGAVRHGGFIPWDDDFDLIMPREDYIKFFTDAYHLLPVGFEARDFHTSKNFGNLGIGKIFVTDQNLVAKVSRASRLSFPNGLFIDIIPSDGMPKKCLPFMLWYVKKRIWNVIVWQPPKVVWRKAYYYILRSLFALGKDQQARMLAYEKWLSKWNYDSSPAVEDLNANYRRFKARAFKAKDFLPTQTVRFDKITVEVPSKVREFLTAIYGDWQKLPPESNRRPGHQ